MNEENHSPVYLITGLLLGLVIGLVYALAIHPVSYVNTDPSALSAEDRDTYRSMIALAYAADGNLERALSRLALLGEADLRGELAAQAQRLMAEPRLFHPQRLPARARTEFDRRETRHRDALAWMT